MMHKSAYRLLLLSLSFGMGHCAAINQASLDLTAPSFSIPYGNSQIQFFNGTSPTSAHPVLYFTPAVTFLPDKTEIMLDPEGGANCVFVTVRLWDKNYMSAIQDCVTQRTQDPTTVTSPIPFKSIQAEYSANNLTGEIKKNSWQPITSKLMPPQESLCIQCPTSSACNEIKTTIESDSASFASHLFVSFATYAPAAKGRVQSQYRVTATTGTDGSDSVAPPDCTNEISKPDIPNSRLLDQTVNGINSSSPSNGTASPSPANGTDFSAGNGTAPSAFNNGTDSSSPVNGTETSTPTSEPDSSTLTSEPDSSTGAGEPDSSTGTSEPDSSTATSDEPDSTTGTSEPNSSTNTSEPDSSTASSDPDASTATSEPDSSTGTTEPDSSTVTGEPGDSSTGTSEPDSSTATSEPDSSTPTSEPDSSTGGNEPDSTSPTSEPDSSTDTSDPDSSTATSEPDASTSSTETDASTTTNETDASTTTGEPDASTTTSEPDASTTTSEPDPSFPANGTGAPSSTNGTLSNSSSNGAVSNSSTNGTVSSPTNGTVSNSSTNGTVSSPNNGTVSKSHTNGTVSSPNNGTVSKSHTNGTVSSPSNGTIPSSPTNGTVSPSPTNGTVSSPNNGTVPCSSTNGTVSSSATNETNAIPNSDIPPETLENEMVTVHWQARRPDTLSAMSDSVIRIRIRDANDKFLIQSSEKTTPVTGEFQLNVSRTNQYSIVFETSGFGKLSYSPILLRNFTQFFTPGSDVYLEPLGFIRKDFKGMGKALGTVRLVNTTGAYFAPGFQVQLRNGLNNVTGPVVATTTTNANGLWSVKLPGGHYTATVSSLDNKFTAPPFTVPVFRIDDVRDCAMTPQFEKGDIRVVLRGNGFTTNGVFGPYDVKLIVTGPLKGKSNKTAEVRANSTVSADKLMKYDYMDQIFGSVLIRKQLPGVYRIQVYETDALQPKPTSKLPKMNLANSQSMVEIYRGDKLWARYYVSLKEGNMWTVAEINGAQINTVNDMQIVPPWPTKQKQAAAPQDILELG
ncbi:serine-rich adhesin for platelets-like [Paramacrobiotus metropolitanus]|uniref:serine-rich adhesin for platelets-like n=1 Tax=Paramacrobiotus metropolitanus TaxID=2943436 RepID=UPI00244580FD|nr:serine-rich adhesin for platelets-like [Paramacrobiotus metropolitanus]